MWTRGALLLALLAGCAGAPRDRPVTVATTPLDAFRAYVAQRLQVPPAQLDDETAEIRGHHDRGAAIAMELHARSTALRVRGWVTADRTVISPKQNLGVLFAEAGVWRRPADLARLAEMLAQDLVWSYSETAVLDPDADAPVLTLDARGAGQLVFFSSSTSGSTDPEFVDPMAREGVTGSGAGSRAYKDVVTLTADHKAMLRREDITR